MKKVNIAIFILLISYSTFAQKYFTKSGTISFEASTALENVAAINKAALSVIDFATGQIEFAVLIKGFEFKKALMQEHFNENYLESHKFPKSVFKGLITNVNSINFQKQGSYPVLVKGTLEIHGIKKEIATNGIMKIAGENIHSEAAFNVKISDYGISIPGVVKDKISPIVKIRIISNYTPLFN